MATRKKTASKAKPPAAAQPNYRLVMGDLESEPGKFDGKTFEEVCFQAQADAFMNKLDVTVWDGPKFLAVARRDGDRDVSLVNAERIFAKPKRPRYCNQTPMIRSTTTFSFPWAPDDIVTMECVILPEGSGESIANMDGPDAEIIDLKGVPLCKGDLYLLQEGGWQEFEHTSFCAFIRFVR